MNTKEINERFDQAWEELKTEIRNCHRIGDIDIVIEEWCEKFGYDADDIDKNAILENAMKEQ